jgi:hypothetical protein
MTVEQEQYSGFPETRKIPHMCPIPRSQSLETYECCKQWVSSTSLELQSQKKCNVSDDLGKPLEQILLVLANSRKTAERISVPSRFPHSHTRQLQTPPNLIARSDLVSACPFPSIDFDVLHKSSITLRK